MYSEFVRYLNSAMHPLPNHIDISTFQPDPEQVGLARLRNGTIQKLANISIDPTWAHQLESIEQAGLEYFHLPEISHMTVAEQRAVDMARAALHRGAMRMGVPADDVVDEKTEPEEEPEEKSATRMRTEVGKSEQDSFHNHTHGTCRITVHRCPACPYRRGSCSLLRRVGL